MRNDMHYDKVKELRLKWMTQRQCAEHDFTQSIYENSDHTLATANWRDKWVHKFFFRSFLPFTNFIWWNFQFRNNLRFVGDRMESKMWH